MAFDKTLPANTTLLRNAPGIITSNWTAIEEGDSSFKPYAVNLQDRTPLVVSNDPSTISGSSIIYVKQDASANPELYSKDGSGNIIQLTDSGYIGGPTSNFRIQNMRFKSGSVDYGANNVLSAAARWDNSMASLSTFRCTASSPGLGTMNISLSDTRSSTNYFIVAQAFNNGDVTCTIGTITTSSFQVFMKTAGSLANSGGWVAVFGGL